MIRSRHRNERAIQLSCSSGRCLFLFFPLRATGLRLVRLKFDECGSSYDAINSPPLPQSKKDFSSNSSILRLLGKRHPGVFM